MGLSSALFVGQPVEEELLCSLCMDVFDRPVNACKEGHTFCAACLTSAQANAPTCPQCRGELFSTPPPNRPLHNMISKLSVRCSNSGAQSGAAPAPPQKRRHSDAAASGDAPEQPTEPRQKQRRTDSGRDSPGQLRTGSAAASADPDPPARGTAGCQWTGTVEQLAEHMKACAFVRVRCGLPGCTLPTQAPSLPLPSFNSVLC